MVSANAHESASFTACAFVKASDNQDIVVGTEIYVSELGLNIKVKQASNPGDDPANIMDNGFISSSIEFENVNDN